jgi:hypothetical protein
MDKEALSLGLGREAKATKRKEEERKERKVLSFITLSRRRKQYDFSKYQ